MYTDHWGILCNLYSFVWSMVIRFVFVSTVLLHASCGPYHGLLWGQLFQWCADQHFLKATTLQCCNIIYMQVSHWTIKNSLHHLSVVILAYTYLAPLADNNIGNKCVLHASKMTKLWLKLGKVVVYVKCSESKKV